MELTKNIFFNTDKLVENSTIKISYTGKLFQDQAESVYIHYGFGLQWDNVSDIKMDKTELGFQAEIYLEESDSFNFCFNDGNGNWDNNDSKNYIFPIEKVQTALVATEQENYSLDKHIGLRKSYIWSKKIKLAIYKILTYIPKLVSGNYKRKIYTNN